MEPIPKPETENLAVLDKRLKDAIQTLYYIQSNIANYAGDETRQNLISQVQKLEPQLAALGLNALPSNLSDLTPEILSAYIDEGRNPDIYTREFVELVIKTNAYLKGRSEAYAEFRDVLAEEIVKGLGPEMEPLVAKAIGREAEGKKEMLNGV